MHDVTILLHNKIIIENQQKLRSQMEAMEAMKQSSNTQSKKPGSISVFSLSHASKHYSTPQSQADSQPIIVPNTDAQTDDDSSSVVQWIGSWIGWK